MNNTVLREMYNGKKNNAIVFFVNSRYRFALAEMLINLQKTNCEVYDNVIVYHADLSKSDIDGFLLIEPKCIFIEYSYDEWIKQYKVPSSAKTQAFLKQYSHLSYEKYRIFELLEFYHKVLFLDLDMLILENISELFEIKGASWRDASEDFGTKLQRYVDIEEFEKWSGVSCRNAKVPNAGLIYISDEMVDYRKCVDEGYRFIEEYIDYFNHAIDELAVSWVVAKMGIELTSLQREHYNTLPAWYTFDTKVLHFMNRDKIWNSELMQTLFPQWMVNYNESKKIVCYDSDAVVEYSKPCVRKKLNEETWFDFFRKTGFQVPEVLSLQYDFSKGGLCMKYKGDIFWEILMDLYTKKYKIGLWVRDKKLVNSIDFAAAMQSLNKINFEHSDKGIYVSTSKMDIEDVASAFDVFFTKTYNCVAEYMVRETLDVDVSRTVPFLVYNKELEDINAKEYFQNIRKQQDRYTIIISCKDECSRYFKEFLDVFGIQLGTPDKRDSYVAIVSNNECILEKKSKYQINYSFKLQYNKLFWVTVVSEGYRYKKEKSSILINNIDYSMNKRGLNFVIIDKYYGCVVDSFNIDTYKDCKFKINRIEEKSKKNFALEEDMNRLISEDKCY